MISDQNKKRFLIYCCKTVALFHSSGKVFNGKMGSHFEIAIQLFMGSLGKTAFIGLFVALSLFAMAVAHV
ncbi:hypothetical protein LY76DRAFT_236501 [Colletotrichum caudatum]|nr:hypothetical protein LY76DRAFT_236501 [Colletotrichum caudatum]